ncbi:MULTISPECIES: 3-mercaptopyruvate sulfurtransferase [Rhizobium/Agrobacterium group]|uniref:3-mercaptopyruvate sulfurtransferase n=2 Tax=Rhizobium/Agrobacterium group TaxID=227290 RepID=B9JVR5_ALLAM|nr:MULTISPECIES: 3-mercaptopyruvate sulfurtransferase [Rhizobium/Agrobacterium group]ACM36345.1 thiosulfate sulfurtransferase [Allorhizobium ampelinum S4]MCF1449793.1 3-mercaptopyruvate sulfurtransferase [Allorhizobium ampelinum]MCF1494767.1 3-mercaptopyruvate sulfurtransferase [Allorhizobium ampelinum]MUO27774.1 3-mercaptopyruvate sulfurtransferase [Agrobacterium vitis]MUO44166.1 3-mercaptopyruvate sulfurtransferase [Agrobacterium vitis]
MSAEKSRFVVSAEWVQKQLGAPQFKVVDASVYLPVHNRNAADEYASGHIPGAVFFDQDQIADHSSSLPHTLPSPERFSEAVGKLGIADTDTIVVYDGPGVYSAPRVWWMLRVMGARDVFVLDGGLDGWKQQGLPLETDLPEPAPATFNATFNEAQVTSFAEMRTIVDDSLKQVADARPAGRFTGQDAEPRAGMRSGHMPGARSVPASILSENGRLKDLSALRAIFTEAGIDLTRPIVTSCGSGVTAAAVTLALQSLGHHDNTLYDGSWSEWGSRKDTPVVTGPADTIEGELPTLLTAHVTKLEMTAPPKSSLPVPINIQTAIIRATEMPLPYYRFLYRQVGSRWHWYKRLQMSDAELKATIHSPDVSICVLYVNGAPAGFFELTQQQDNTVELSYFGLFEHALGLGIGKWFLLQALYAAWSTAPTKISVMTNTLDHPRALQLYQQFGFSPVETWNELVEPPSESSLLDILKRDYNIQ